MLYNYQMNKQILPRCKVALAVGVAAMLYADALKTASGEGRYNRMRMAADAVDRTYPEPDIALAYRTKNPGEPDALFLLRHMDKLHPMPKAEWPKYKIKPREWGIFTRVMRGLETFVEADEPPVVARGPKHADIEAVLKFVAPLMQDFPPEIFEAFKTFATSIGVELRFKTNSTPSGT